MDDLPGYAQAKKLGYGLHAHAGNRLTAFYTKQLSNNRLLHIEIFTKCDKCHCKISAIYKMVTITTGELSFPHPNLELFENQVLECLPVGV